MSEYLLMPTGGNTAEILQVREKTTFLKEEEEEEEEEASLTYL